MVYILRTTIQKGMVMQQLHFYYVMFSPLIYGPVQSKSSAAPRGAYIFLLTVPWPHNS